MRQTQQSSASCSSSPLDRWRLRRDWVLAGVTAPRARSPHRVLSRRSSPPLGEAVLVCRQRAPATCERERRGGDEGKASTRSLSARTNEEGERHRLQRHESERRKMQCCTICRGGESQQGGEEGGEREGGGRTRAKDKKGRRRRDAAPQEAHSISPSDSPYPSPSPSSSSSPASSPSPATARPTGSPALDGAALAFGPRFCARLPIERWCSRYLAR